MSTGSSTESLARPTTDADPAPTGAGIQPAGFLFLLSREWLVERVSANAGPIFGRDSAALVGTPLVDWLGSEAVHSIRNQLSLIRSDDAIARLCGCVAGSRGERFDFSIQADGHRAIVEGFASGSTDGGDTIATVRGLVSRLEPIDDAPALLSAAARQIRALTGYDRVAIYRRLGDGSACLAAHAARDQHPAAGQLSADDYRSIAAQRLIADLDGAPLAVIGGACPARALLRQPGTEQARLARSSGAAARLAQPLVSAGKQWGLLLCDHPTPRLANLERQSALGLFLQMLGLLVRLREGRPA